jgi:putative aldouronate transport system substrate-binding protein
MKMRMRKILLASILAMVMVFAACGQASTGGDSAPTGTTGATPPVADGARTFGGIDVSDFVEVIWYHMGDWPLNNQVEAAAAEWNVILEEKVNAHLTLRFIGWTDWPAQYALRLAAGDGFDMIFTSTTWLDAWPNAQRGAFLALDDLLPRYAPRTWAAVPAEHWDQCRFNGQIVMIPGDSYTQWVNHGFFYRGDWADQMGLPGPISNWHMLADYMQGILDLFGGEVVPWDVGPHPALWDLWVASHTPSLEIFGEAGLFRVRDRNNLTELYSPVFEDTFMDFAVTMHSWGERGFWREDVLHFTGDTRALLREGQTGIDQHHTQTYRGLLTDMERDQPGADLRMFHVHLDPANGGDNLMRSTITHDAMSVAANARNPGVR